MVDVIVGVDLAKFYMEREKMNQSMSEKEWTADEINKWARVCVTTDDFYEVVAELHNAEVAQLRDRLDFIAKDERACCPDHVGFREYITRLRRELEEAKIWELLPSYLIDHYEGETVSEEFLQRALAAMMADKPWLEKCKAVAAAETNLSVDVDALTGCSDDQRFADVPSDVIKDEIKNLSGSVSGAATAPRRSLMAEHIAPESPFESGRLGGEGSASPAQSPTPEVARPGEVVWRDLRSANLARQKDWCPEQVPDLSFRGNELAGEVGEVCNVIKKLERERLGWRGSRDSKEHLAEELADVVICADLIGIAAEIDLERAVIAKFNATSEKVGLPHRLRRVVVPEQSQFAESFADIREAVGAEYDGMFLDKAVADLRERALKAEREFKNFHRLLCERFGYIHDEVHWQRDHLSLIEAVAFHRQPQTWISLDPDKGGRKPTVDDSGPSGQVIFGWPDGSLEFADWDYEGFDPEPAFFMPWLAVLQLPPLAPDKDEDAEALDKALAEAPLIGKNITGSFKLGWDAAIAHARAAQDAEIKELKAKLKEYKEVNDPTWPEETT